MKENPTGLVEHIPYVAHIVHQGDEHHKSKPAIDQRSRNHTPGDDQGQRSGPPRLMDIVRRV